MGRFLHGLVITLAWPVVAGIKRPKKGSGVAPGMPIFDEETFGPVAVVCRVEGADEAVALANRSAFGLGAAVFTKDREMGERLARKLRAGTVAINAQVVSDPRLPFGGIRESGWGRELGREGIREFVNVKTIVREELPERD